MAYLIQDGLDLIVRYLIYPLLEVVYLQYFDMDTGLARNHGEIRIHIQHARISMTKEAYSTMTQTMSSCCRPDPTTNFSPGSNAGFAILFAQKPAYDVEAD